MPTLSVSLLTSFWVLHYISALHDLYDIDEPGQECEFGMFMFVESLFWSRLSNSMNLYLEPIFLSMFDGLDVERSNGHSRGMWITWSLNLAQSKVAYTRYMCPKRWRPVWGSWLASHYSQANASSWNLHICSLNCSMTFSLPSCVSAIYQACKFQSHIYRLLWMYNRVEHLTVQIRLFIPYTNHNIKIELGFSVQTKLGFRFRVLKSGWQVRV